MISVVIPVYNVKEYLEKCVGSILSQTFSDLEIILVDDGSTDGSGELCDELKVKDSRIKVIHKVNGGLPSAWKTGAEAANGEIIGFVDSDDYCDSDYFNLLASAIYENGADIAIGGYVTEYPDYPEKNYRHSASGYLEAGEYEGEALENIKEKIFSEKATLHWARWLRVIKKSILLDNLHFVDERIRVGEDMGIALATLFDAKKVVIVNTYGYHYLQRGNSMMRTITDKEISNYEFLCDNIYQISAEKGYTENICREFTTQMITVLWKIMRANMRKKEKIDLMKKLRKTANAKRVYKERNFGKRSSKGRILLWLFGKSLFRSLALLSSMALD